MEGGGRRGRVEGSEDWMGGIMGEGLWQEGYGSGDEGREEEGERGRS